ncbi:MAG: hypothetical protein A2139_11085 [Desulfobacca sp. RBG_16_60_12]|nr:MAG: hypothetical protein A2139_11085 [Desulfobacca sp. RBG_16_60_12]
MFEDKSASWLAFGFPKLDLFGRQVLQLPWKDHRRTYPQMLHGPLRVLAGGMESTHRPLGDRAPVGGRRPRSRKGSAVWCDLPCMGPVELVAAMLIASTSHAHVDQIIAAAKAGKAVLCEKPMILT